VLEEDSFLLGRVLLHKLFDFPPVHQIRKNRDAGSQNRGHEQKEDDLFLFESVHRAVRHVHQSHVEGHKVRYARIKFFSRKEAVIEEVEEQDWVHVKLSLK